MSKRNEMRVGGPTRGPDGLRDVERCAADVRYLDHNLKCLLRRGDYRNARTFRSTRSREVYVVRNLLRCGFARAVIDEVLKLSAIKSLQGGVPEDVLREAVRPAGEVRRVRVVAAREPTSHHPLPWVLLRTAGEEESLKWRPEPPSMDFRLLMQFEAALGVGAGSMQLEDLEGKTFTVETKGRWPECRILAVVPSGLMRLREELR